MARKEDMSDANNDTHQFGVFTLNETRIGKGGDNRKRSDIQLIQFFLRQYFKYFPEVFALMPKTKASSKYFTIDGKYGKQTEEGILVFQVYARNAGMTVAWDGLVNVPHSVESSITKTTYTIHHLNAWFLKFGDGNEYHGSLENHPDIIHYAPELRSELIAATVGNQF